MGHTHVHLPPPAAGSPPDSGGQSARMARRIATRRRRRAMTVLAAVLAPLAAAIVVGLVVLWPSGDKAVRADPSAAFAAPGVSFPDATVTKVRRFRCPDAETGSPAAGKANVCADVAARLGSGDHGPTVSVQVPTVIVQAGIGVGDEIKLVRTPASAGTPASYSFLDFARGVPLLLLAGVFAAVVVLVARLRGLAALAGLGISYLVLVKFMLPALVAGESPVAVALVGSGAIVFVVLYVAHGFSTRTTTALAGTLFGLALTAGLAAWATGAGHLTGLGSEDSATLAGLAGQVHLSGLLLCGIIVAGLGVLNDVTVTQASAVWELDELSPTMPARKLFASAMRIGRDHIASTVYTVAFAYAGAALPVLLLIGLSQRPLVAALTGEDLAEEIVRTLVGSIGLVLAIPATTAIGVVVVKTANLRRPPGA